MSNKDKILLSASIVMFLISGVFLYFNFFAPQYVTFLPTPAGPSQAAAGLTQAQVIDNQTQSSYRKLDSQNSAWKKLWEDNRFISLSGQALIPVDIRPDEYGQKTNPFLPLDYSKNICDEVLKFAEECEVTTFEDYLKKLE